MELLRSGMKRKFHVPFWRRDRGSNALIDSNIQLNGEELEQLKVLWKEYGAQNYAIPKDLVNERWQLKGLLESEGSRTYQFTNLGLIPVGALPLALFNQVQEPLLVSGLASLEGSVEIAEAAGLSCLEERRADLLIYRAQLRRILVNSLYFLEVCDSLPSNQWIKPRNNTAHSH